MVVSLLRCRVKKSCSSTELSREFQTHLPESAALYSALYHLKSRDGFSCPDVSNVEAS